MRVSESAGGTPAPRSAAICLELMSEWRRDQGVEIWSYLPETAGPGLDINSYLWIIANVWMP